MRYIVKRRKEPRIDFHIDALRLARRKVDLRKSDEALRRLPAARCRRSVDLAHGHAATLARVAQSEAHVDAAVASRSCADRAVSKTGVAEPVTKREQRLQPLPVDPFVADRRAFAVIDGELVHFRIAAGSHGARKL